MHLASSMVTFESTILAFAFVSLFLPLSVRS